MVMKRGHEDSSRLKYGAVWIVKWLPAFRRNLLPPSSVSM